jgi:hypothetical protein
MDQLVPPVWQDGGSLLLAPWRNVPGSSTTYLIDAWGRCQLHGEVYYPNTDPPDATPIMMCPLGTTPTQDYTQVAVEDCEPARMYRVDIRTDGRIYLRYPALNTTGQLFLDNISWIIPPNS